MASLTHRVIDLTCQQCGAVYHSEEAYIGKHLRCARCGTHVPILDAARDIVRQTARPTSSVSQGGRIPPARFTIRPKSRYMVPVVVGIMTILGVIGFVAYFVHDDAPRTGAAGITEIEPATHQEQPQEQPSTQDSNFDFQIIGQEKKPKHEKPPQVDVPRPTEYNSLPTGTLIVDNADSDGNGELEVENGTGDDAVVCLNRNGVDVSETLLGSFVQRHSTAHIHKIPEGTYILDFTTGLDWIELERVFRRHPAYSEFERSFDFSEERNGNAVQYHSISVTLQAVPDGNVRTRSITRERFLRGHTRISLRH